MTHQAAVRLWFFWQSALPGRAADSLGNKDFNYPRWAVARRRRFRPEKGSKDLQRRGLQALVERRIVRYAGTMRYPDGGGLAAQERARRERVRLAAAGQPLRLGAATIAVYWQHGVLEARVWPLVT